MVCGSKISGLFGKQAYICQGTFIYAQSIMTRHVRVAVQERCTCSEVRVDASHAYTHIHTIYMYHVHAKVHDFVELRMYMYTDMHVTILCTHTCTPAAACVADCSIVVHKQCHFKVDGQCSGTQLQNMNL